MEVSIKHTEVRRMKLEKAIEVLSAVEHNHNLTLTQSFHDANKLGIEALKHIACFHEDDDLLPGETTE